MYYRFGLRTCALFIQVNVNGEYNLYNNKKKVIFIYYAIMIVFYLYDVLILLYYNKNIIKKILFLL